MEISSCFQDRKNYYCEGVFNKYEGDYPIWAFLEIIPLGTMLPFYGFCADKLANDVLRDKYYLLKTIKDIRNAAAHSNCILLDMSTKDSKYKTNYSVLRALTGITKASRDSQLGNERMRQMITLLYTHTVFVTSEGVHNHTRDLLKALVVRMYYHIDYYSDNENILKAFDFFKKAVDLLYV